MRNAHSEFSPSQRIALRAALEQIRRRRAAIAPDPPAPCHLEWKWLCLVGAIALGLVVVASLTGCASTRIEVPAQWIAPGAPAGTPPAVYSSSKNVALSVRSTSTTLAIDIIGDAATVNTSRGEAAVTILKASEGVIEAIPISALGR